MTYWIYNPQSLKDAEMEGKPTEDIQKRCADNGLLIFYEYLEVTIRRNDDEKEKSIISSVNHEIECFENTDKSNSLIKIQTNQDTDKSNHGGKRPGAGRKKGSSVKHSEQTKLKIANRMSGNQNAVKSKGE